MGLLLLAGLIALIAAGSYFALHRDEIPYETLAARYGTVASRSVDLPGGVHLHYRDPGTDTGAKDNSASAAAVRSFLSRVRERTGAL